MINVEFSIWIASKSSWVHLVKSIPMAVVPRVGEYIKFVTENFDYVPWKVSQVTYLENGLIEVWTELLNNIDNRKYSFDDEGEFEDCLNDFKSNGWVIPKGIKQNPYTK